MLMKGEASLARRRPLGVMILAAGAVREKLRWERLRGRELAGAAIRRRPEDSIVEARGRGEEKQSTKERGGRAGR